MLGSVSDIQTDPLPPEVPNKAGATRHTPLMHSDRKVAETFEPVAQKCRKGSMHLPDNRRINGVRLVTFTTTEGARH